MSNGGQHSIPGMGHPVIPKPVPPAIPKVPPPLPKPPPPVVAKPPPPRIAKPEVPLGPEALSPGPGGRTTVMAKAKKLTHWEVIFRIGVLLVMLAPLASPTQIRKITSQCV